ncbi:MAG: hypothetical protein JNK82_18530 [Myxococcaceae bacterium]|nr:hypothetical protein [Myxococcaceae bacterium]
MSDQPEGKYLDKRTAERYQRTGKLDDKAWEKHLKSLPDVADKAMPVESSMGDIDDEDDDEGEDDEG